MTSKRFIPLGSIRLKCKTFDTIYHAKFNYTLFDYFRKMVVKFSLKKISICLMNPTEVCIL